MTEPNKMMAAVKPVWELNNELNATRSMVKNAIVDSKKIEELVVKAAHEGLNATEPVYWEGKEVAVKPDYSTRHKYWRDILIMKKWLSKTDVNVDIRALTINAQEEEILKRYSGE